MYVHRFNKELCLNNNFILSINHSCKIIRVHFKIFTLSNKLLGSSKIYCINYSKIFFKHLLKSISSANDHYLWKLITFKYKLLLISIEIPHLFKCNYLKRRIIWIDISNPESIRIISIPNNSSRYLMGHGLIIDLLQDWKWKALICFR